MKRILMAAAVVAISGGAAQAAPVGLLGLYQFNNADLSDSSGNGNNGTAAAGVTFEANGKAVGDGAARFAAVSGLSGFSVPIDINASALPAMTFGAWVSVDPATAALGKFLSHDNGSFDRTLGLDTRGGGTANDFSAFTGSGVLAGGARVDNVFTHVAASYDGTNVNLFVNGVLTATAADSTGADVGLTSLFVGTNPGFNEDFVGLMDDVFVFNRALNEAEIAGIVQNGFEISSVPIPAAAPMLALALAGLALVGRRCQA